MQFIRIFLFVCMAVLITPCCTNNDTTGKKNNRKNRKIKKAPNPLEIKIEPKDNEKFTVGDIITFGIDVVDTVKYDSARIFVNKKLMASVDSLPFRYEWNSIQSKVGRINCEVRLFRDNTSRTRNQSVLLLSDIVPEKQSYKIIKTFPHDINAYTQGLFYHEGYFYEATGLKGKSSVRKVKPETGEVFQSYTIPSEYFGEGITLHDNQIIQLTWQAHVGFVYGKNDFKLIQTFNYPTQGWGITTIDDKLIMSDGTSTIYYLHGSSFGEIDRISVFDNEQQVTNINELEYINGEILANIYGETRIARIDPKTGKVLAYINLDGILEESDKHDQIDVLNGIAYDKAGDRLFVTGKRWPKLFEIKIITADK